MESEQDRQQLMKKIRDYSIQLLEKGRGGYDWDIPHTDAVTHYAIQIAQAEGLDLLVMETAARFHDIGYSGLFDDADSTSHAQVMDKKAEHMVRGAEFARKFLEREDIAPFYAPEQAKRIVHLVGVHDKLGELSDPDELALMEADTLGAIDLSRITPTFTGENARRYIKGLKTKRIPLFSTQIGNEYLAELLPKFEAYYVQTN